MADPDARPLELVANFAEVHERCVGDERREALAILALLLRDTRGYAGYGEVRRLAFNQLAYLQWGDPVVMRLWQENRYEEARALVLAGAAR